MDEACRPASPSRGVYPLFKIPAVNVLVRINVLFGLGWLWAGGPLFT
ncbi:hypothetical protein SynNOUM97013_01315 [Synechococcus sp. NOUM97013]|nr:hypothetical protein SynNOUM97013_01315 [Synechococcus sp. NOUM97013]